MANVLFGGFHPDQEVRPRARRYPVASNYNTALFRGDFVTLLTTGYVAASTAGDTALLLGAIKEVSYVTGGKRVSSTYLPANTTYSGGAFGSDESWVWVYDDPSQEYWVNMASNAATDTAAENIAIIGSNMDLVATAGNTVYRCSGYTLDGNPIAGTAQFRINEIKRTPGRSYTTANLAVKCSVNEGFHAFFSGAGI